MASQQTSQLPYGSSRQTKQALNDGLVPIGKQRILVGNIKMATGASNKKRKNFSTQMSPKKYQDLVGGGSNMKPLKLNRTTIQNTPRTR